MATAEERYEKEKRRSAEQAAKAREKAAARKDAKTSRKELKEGGHMAAEIARRGRDASKRKGR